MKSKTPRVYYKPYSKIVVRHCCRIETPEKLAKFTKIIDDISESYLLWSNGILFNARTGEGEYAEIERLKGIAHFIFVFFCDLPVYEPEIMVDGTTIKVLDLTNDPLHSALATWIRNQGQIYAMT